MAGEKKLIKDVTLGRDKEIRVRYVKKEDLQALTECSRILGEKSIPGTVLRLIHGFKGGIALTRQLQARNTQLNAALLEMYKDRERVVKLLQDFIKQTDKVSGQATDRAKKVLKGLGKGGAKKRSSTR